MTDDFTTARQRRYDEIAREVLSEQCVGDRTSLVTWGVHEEVMRRLNRETDYRHDWDGEFVGSPDNVVHGAFVNRSPVDAARPRESGTFTTVLLNPDDPAVSVLGQCEVMPVYLRCDDEPTRRVETLRLRLFCDALLAFWEAE